MIEDIKVKILVVDDDPHQRMVMQYICKRHFDDDTIFLADSVDAANKIIADISPDIIIVDLMMPVKSGIDLMNENFEIFKSHDKHVVVVTANPEILSTDTRLINDCIDKIFVKPTDTDVLTAYLLKIQQQLSAIKQNKLFKIMAQHFSTPMNVGHSFVITDKEGKIVYVNDGLLQMTGYERKDLIGNTPRVWKSGIHDVSYYKCLWDTVLSGKPWVGDMCNKRKDGTLFWERARIVPYQDESTEITNFIALKENISDLKDIDLKFKTIVNSSPDLIFILTLDGVFLENYPESSKDLFFSREEFIGKNIEDVFAKHHIVHAFKAAVNRLLETGYVQEFEYSMDVNGHVIYHEARISRLNGSRLVVIVRNITERKKAKVLEELSESMERLISSTNEIITNNPDIFAKE